MLEHESTGLLWVVWVQYLWVVWGWSMLRGKTNYRFDMLYIDIITNLSMDIHNQYNTSCVVCIKDPIEPWCFAHWPGAECFITHHCASRKQKAKIIERYDLWREDRAAPIQTSDVIYI